jgi:hypothetical protein
MLTVILLSFLQCDFQIFHTLEQNDPSAKQQLLKVSADMISLIEELGSFRRKAIYLHRRFSYIVSQGPAVLL